MRRLDILIVDDDAAVARGTWRQLRRHHDVRLASSAADARAQFAERVPDCVLSDYNMYPETGADLLRWVAAAYPSVRRVLYSGSLSVDEAAALACAHAVLSKPAQLDALLAALAGA